MTPRDRAERLIEKFLWSSQTDIHKAKHDLTNGIVGLVERNLEQAALIADWKASSASALHDVSTSRSRRNEAKELMAQAEGIRDKIRALKTDDIPDKTLTSYKLGEE